MASIEDELKRFYADDVPSVDASKKLQAIELVARESQRMAFIPICKPMSFCRFVLTQMRFISPLCWVLQIALIVCVLIAGNVYRTSEIQIPLTMTFAVLTVAIAIPSVFKSLESKSSELEFACRFNCTQVLASRLIIFGLGDVLWFSIVIAEMPSFMSSDSFSVFLYTSAPFFLFCALCFYLARVTKEHVAKATVASAVIAIAILWQSIGLLPRWYSELSWAVWIIALLFAIALAAFELRCLIGSIGFAVSPGYIYEMR